MFWFLLIAASLIIYFAIACLLVFINARFKLKLLKDTLGMEHPVAAIWWLPGIFILLYYLAYDGLEYMFDKIHEVGSKNV